MPNPSYLVQEEDGTSRFALEEGGGFILLAVAVGVGSVVGNDYAAASVSGGTEQNSLMVGGPVVASVSGGSVEDAAVSGGSRIDATVEPT